MAKPAKLRIAPEVTISRLVMRPTGPGSWSVFKQTVTGPADEVPVVEGVAYHLAQLEMEQGHEDLQQQRRDEEGW